MKYFAIFCVLLFDIADFFSVVDFLHKTSMQTEILYLARFNRQKLIAARYQNYKDFYDNNLNDEKFYIINNYGHLNHLKYLFQD